MLSRHESWGTSKLSLDEEIRANTKRIRLSQYLDERELVFAWAVLSDDLLQELNTFRPDIVHFSGHGTGQGLMLIGTDGLPKLASNRALKANFTTLKENIRLVALNACYSQV